MINIPFSDVVTQINAFLGSSIVSGSIGWMIGIGLGSFLVYSLLQAFRR